MLARMNVGKAGGGREETFEGRAEECGFVGVLANMIRIWHAGEGGGFNDEKLIVADSGKHLTLQRIDSGTQTLRVFVRLRKE